MRTPTQSVPTPVAIAAGIFYALKGHLMLSLNDRDAVAAALTDPTIDPALRALIGLRVWQVDTDRRRPLAEVLQIVAVQPGDTSEEIHAAVGFPTRLPFVSIKHGWQKAIEVAKLPGLRLHDLRHSAASFMVNSGVDLFAVGKVLGHASYQSTQRYSHLANDTLLKAVEAGAAKQAAF